MTSPTDSEDVSEHDTIVLVKRAEQNEERRKNESQKRKN